MTTLLVMVNNDDIVVVFVIQPGLAVASETGRHLYSAHAYNARCFEMLQASLYSDNIKTFTSTAYFIF